MSLSDRLRGHNESRLQAEKEAGARFLQENRNKPGVQELPGGIQYEVLTEGNGSQPSPTSTIEAHYAGRLINGQEFDSSFRRNQPFQAPLTHLIQGWQQVIPMMKEGSHWKIWIPSDLAYGDRGAGGSIPGGATLEFEIQLLRIIR